MGSRSRSSRAVARLLERELVERDTHGDDRRRSVLALSRAGRRIYDGSPLALELERRLPRARIATNAPRDALLDKLRRRHRHLADAPPVERGIRTLARRRSPCGQDATPTPRRSRRNPLARTPGMHPRSPRCRCARLRGDFESAR